MIVNIITDSPLFSPVFTSNLNYADNAETSLISQFAFYEASVIPSEITPVPPGAAPVNAAPQRGPVISPPNRSILI